MHVLQFELVEQQCQPEEQHADAQQERIGQHGVIGAFLPSGRCFGLTQLARPMRRISAANAAKPKQEVSHQSDHPNLPPVQEYPRRNARGISAAGRRNRNAHLRPIGLSG